MQRVDFLLAAMFCHVNLVSLAHPASFIKFPVLFSPGKARNGNPFISDSWRNLKCRRVTSMENPLQIEITMWDRDNQYITL